MHKTRRFYRCLQNDADDIITSSQNLLEIINDVLDISKLETNNMKITEEDYKPLEIFEM